jgi:hypothetical protein
MTMPWIYTGLGLACLAISIALCVVAARNARRAQRCADDAAELLGRIRRTHDRTYERLREVP